MLERAVETLHEILEKDGHTLLYLTLFGSKLYGTATETSDTDLRGIFLPSKQSCLLGNAPKHFTYTDEQDDVSVWSIQVFMNMLSRGDTNAVDVLFSQTNREAVIYSDPNLHLFRQYKSLLDLNKCHGFIGYALEQSKRFGIKTERYSVVKNIYDYLCHLQQHQLYDPMDRLGNYVERIVEEADNISMCHRVLGGNNSVFIKIGQTLHELGITMDEFCERITTEMNKFGKRTQKATENDGIDFKALSHSVRAIFEMDQLVEDGQITFPLKEKELIRNIKCGILSFSEVEKIIQEGLERHYPGRTYLSDYKFDKGIADGIILDFYR